MKKLPIPEIRRAGKPMIHTKSAGALIMIYASKKMTTQISQGNLALISHSFMLPDTNH